MDAKQKQMLGRQLEQQAAVLGTKSGAALSGELLLACGALLRAAGKNLPEKLADDEFDRVCAAYLGVAGSVQRFLQANGARIGAANGSALEQLRGEIDKLTADEAKYAGDMAALRKQRDDAEARAVKAAEEYGRLAEEQEQATQPRDTTERKLSEGKTKIERLRTNTQRMQKEAASLDGEAERLVKETAEARATLADMKAYYTELERIETGIQAEGYVDIMSFNDALGEMNEQGKALMERYDHFLNGMLQDVEALQNRLRDQTRPGAAK